MSRVLLEIDRAVLAQSRVKPLAIVPNLNILKDRRASLGPRSKWGGHTFSLEGAKEILLVHFAGTTTTLECPFA